MTQTKQKFVFGVTFSPRNCQYEKSLTRLETIVNFLLLQFLDEIQSSKTCATLYFVAIFDYSKQHSVKKHFCGRRQKVTNLCYSWLFNQTLSVIPTVSKNHVLCTFNCTLVDVRRFSGEKQCIFLFLYLQVRQDFTIVNEPFN